MRRRTPLDHAARTQFHAFPSLISSAKCPLARIAKAIIVKVTDFSGCEAKHAPSTTFGDSQFGQVSGGGELIVGGGSANGLPESKQIVRFTQSPGVKYSAGLEKSVEDGSKQAPEEFLATLKRNSEFIVEEGPLVAANAGMVNGKPHAFLTNFAGIAPHKNVVPLRESAARVSVPASRKCILEFCRSWKKRGQSFAGEKGSVGV